MATTLNFSSIGADTIVVEDNGDPTDGVLQVRSTNGLFATFQVSVPADQLSLVFGANQKLVWNFDEDMGATVLNIGSLTNAAVNPTLVTIDQITAGFVNIAATGAIAELGSDVGADISAASIALLAGTGIGAGNAIETETGSIEAQTNTGGITISEVSDLTIGNSSLDLVGLRVITSGSINVTAAGSILIDDMDGSGAVVSSGANSGHVTLSATGIDSFIKAFEDRDAIESAAGNITLNATGDVAFGTEGFDFDNDVRANGSITITAGGDFTIDGFSDMASDDFGANTGGNVTITADNISVVNFWGEDASVTASGSAGGDVIFNTASGGTVAIETSAGGVFSSSGNVTINADDVSLGFGATVQALSGVVILRPTTAGRRINLGDSDTFGLDLTDAELDLIATQELIIGSSSAGALVVSGSISNTSPNLTLISGDNILVKAVTLATTGGLTLKAGRDIAFGAASTVTVGGVLNGFLDTPSNDPEGGILTLLGALTAASITFLGLGDVDYLNGSANGETLVGNSGNDVLKGMAGNDVLQGGAGNDTLEGGADNDTLDGGIGSDTASYASASGGVTVNLASGAAQNTGGAGIDTLIAIENLIGSAFNDTLFGTAAANTIHGGAGDDLIKPEGGSDTVYGGAGNDDIYVDSAGDKVFELVGEGDDRILTTVSYTLPVNVETLTLVGASAINGTGNSAVNTIIGNDANNVLSGGAGADILRGNGGADTLDGGVGPDLMQGGTGNDTYVVDQTGDVISEGVDAGLDQVNSSATITLSANVENVTLTGANAVNATGNTGSNVIIGNGAANNITGGGDNDTLTGGAGADTFVYSALTDSTLADSDVITDYVDGVDRLNLSTLDANTDLGGNQAFARLAGDGAFTAAAQLRLTFDGTYTRVELNTDADADAEMAILLTGNHTADTVDDNWLL